MDNRELFAHEDAREQNRMLRELDDDEHNNLTRTNKRKIPPNSVIDSDE